MTTSAKIFLVARDRNQLIPMQEQPYKLEKHLQELLARYPDLIPGDQIDPEQPRRWLLVAREMAVPDEENASGRWSLDHLFLDQDGIPTFVECKRSSDTRGRREVVAQMLDYAANGLEYWNIQRLRQEAAETAQDQQSDLDQRVVDLIGADNEASIEDFWARVEDNLQRGRVRMIFVADRIPRELRRLVEFLNDKLNDIEVLAVEVKQFQGEAHTVLVPRVLGITEAARSKKSAKGQQRYQSIDEFLVKVPTEAHSFFQWLVDLSDQMGHTVYLGGKDISFRVFSPSQDKLITIAYGSPVGKLQLYLQFLKLTPEENRELREQLREFNVFQESGQYTLNAFPSSQNEQALKEAYRVYLNFVQIIL